MANKQTIIINDIRGGHSDYSLFAEGNQYQNSLAIDPDLPSTSYSSTSYSIYGRLPSGLIRPSNTKSITIEASSAMSNWMVTNPKNALLYIYDSKGSIYTQSGSTPSGLGDLNDGGTASGNGAAYHDNYIYFARDTTIARYGPLDGTPTFTDDYWVGTLGLTALTNTTYPIIGISNEIPNHCLHRHEANGCLYIADVLDNQGVLHYISTTKTTVEGDTNNGSVYDKVSFPYGYWPTAIESVGNDLAIALFEGAGGSNTTHRRPAKLAIWDTTSQNFSAMIEFPDPIISALQYDKVTGTLICFSGQLQELGTRVSVYLGGETFQQIKIIPEAAIPLPGAVEQVMNRIYFASYRYAESSLFSGSFTTYPSMWAIGSSLDRTTNNLYNILVPPIGGVATALKTYSINGASLLRPVMAFSASNTMYTGTQNDFSGLTFKSRWESANFKIGRRFKITSLSVPITFNTVANPGVTITPVIHTDNSLTETPLASIRTMPVNNIDRYVKYNTGIDGTNNFSVEFVWEGVATDSSPLTLGLPIVIEYEIIEE